MGLESLEYTDLIAQSQRELDRLIIPPSLNVNIAARTLQVADAAIRLTPVEIAVYRLLAEGRRACGKPACLGCAVCALEAHDFDRPEVLSRLGEHLKAVKIRDERTRALSGWKNAAYQRFREVRARINGRIVQALGTGNWVDRYLIAATGGRPDTRYYLPLPPELIHLE
jgi:hypothetical protein